MKQVKIRIVGDLLIWNYCSLRYINPTEEDLENGAEEDEDGFFSNYYVTGAWETLTAMYIDDNEDENVIKQKGKYVKTKEYFHDLFSEDGDHPLPVEVHARTYHNQELEYIVELPDDEEFDIKKVQLIKSDYELSEAPYFILCSKILYDGKEVLANAEFNDWTEYCPEMKIYDTFTIEGYVN